MALRKSIVIFRAAFPTPVVDNSLVIHKHQENAIPARWAGVPVSVVTVLGTTHITTPIPLPLFAHTSKYGCRITEDFSQAVRQVLGMPHAA